MAKDNSEFLTLQPPTFKRCSMSSSVNFAAADSLLISHTGLLKKIDDSINIEKEEKEEVAEVLLDQHQSGQLASALNHSKKRTKSPSKHLLQCH